MSELTLKDPVKLHMEVVESDDILPSIKMSVKVEIDYPTGIFTYKVSDIWFDCLKWDEFVSNLNQVGIQEKEAVLTDMSEDFMISVNNDGETYRLSFKGKKSLIGSKASASINYETEVDLEVLSKIRGNFNEFPKWW